MWPNVFLKLSSSPSRSTIHPRSSTHDGENPLVYRQLLTIPWTGWNDLLGNMVHLEIKTVFDQLASDHVEFGFEALLFPCIG